MVLFNATLQFPGSGKITALTDTIHFNDTFLTTALRFGQAGQAGLDNRFVTNNFNSVVGALNFLVDAVFTTSGNITTAVRQTTVAVDTPAFVHNLTHNLNTHDVTVDMYDTAPQGLSGVNIIQCYTPTSLNTVRVLLDASSSGFFIVRGV